MHRYPDYQASLSSRAFMKQPYRERPKTFHLSLQRRSFFVIFIFAFSFMTFLVVHSDYHVLPHVVSFFGQTPDPVSRPGFLVDTVGCQMPEFDPYHPSVSKYIKRLSYSCSGKKPFILISNNSVLILDEDRLRRDYHMRRQDLNCAYRSITRDHKKDGYKLGKQFHRLVFDTPLREDAVYVKCLKGSKLLVEEYLPLIAIQSEIESRCVRAEMAIPPNEDKLNVIIIGVDSISKLNFIRHLPRTRHYLLNTFNAIELKGYNKVGDNTFPNLVSLLSGNLVTSKFQEIFKNRHFDDLDLIWKRYAKIGYRTLMAEDAPKIAVFNYGRKGFLNQPSDYYLRPFSLAVEKSAMKSRSKRFCFQSKLEMRVVYDYLLNFLETMTKRSLFAFAFVARLTHDDVNKAVAADGPVLDTLKRIEELGYRNNSLILFMSDHGLRFGAIRKTFVGRFEEHWPIMFLSFPPWFYEKYPKIYRNLMVNQHRLTTPLDVHETFVDLLNMAKKTKNRSSSTFLPSEYGISLFKEVPPERTCSDAGIDPHWCTCQSLVPADPKSAELHQGALSLVTTVNEWLSPEREACELLNLKKIVSAHVTRANQAALTGRESRKKSTFTGINDVQTDYLIVVEVLPSDAVFEATVRFDKKSKTFTVLGDISRINVYGDQSHCVFDSWLKKFCYCKELL